MTNYDYVRRVPDNVVNLKPVEIIHDHAQDPAMAQFLLVTETLARIENRIGALEDRLAVIGALEERLAVIEGDIGATKSTVSLVYDNVKPTLDMLTNGPVGQLLGIAPAPTPRERNRIGRRG